MLFRGHDGGVCPRGEAAVPRLARHPSQAVQGVENLLDSGTTSIHVSGNTADSHVVSS